MSSSSSTFLSSSSTFLKLSPGCPGFWRNSLYALSAQSLTFVGRSAYISRKRREVNDFIRSVHPEAGSRRDDAPPGLHTPGTARGTDFRGSCAPMRPHHPGLRESGTL